jgi:PAS domain S-box
VRDTNETIIGACCISIDISDRKASEEQLQFQSRILHQMREVVIAIDTQGQIRYCNPAAESFHGKSAAEILGRRSEEVMRYRYPNKQSRQAAKQALEQEGLWQGDVIYLSHHSGKERIVLLSMAKLYTDEHKPNGLLCVLEDVTERRQAELELKKTQEQLREIIPEQSCGAILAQCAGHIFVCCRERIGATGLRLRVIGRKICLSALFAEYCVFARHWASALG